MAERTSYGSAASGWAPIAALRLRVKLAPGESKAFLFRLGCYSGEPITIVSKKKKSCVVVIKDGRYNLDQLLSEAIII